MKKQLALKKILPLLIGTLSLSASVYASESAPQKSLAEQMEHERISYLLQLKKQGHSATTLRHKYYYSAHQLIKAGFTLRQLLGANYPYKELRRIGFTIKDFLAAGVKRHAIFSSKAFSWHDMAQAGIVSKNAYGRFLENEPEGCGCWW
jgi:hypothetical protein